LGTLRLRTASKECRDTNRNHQRDRQRLGTGNIHNMNMPRKTRYLLATLFVTAATVSAWQSPETSSAQRNQRPPVRIAEVPRPEHLGGLVDPIEMPGLNQSPAEKVLAMQLARLSVNDPYSHDANAQFHAHGDQVCASGCAASRHPTETLAKAEFARLMRRLEQAPLERNNLAFETLLFYGRQTSDMLLKHGAFGVTASTLSRLNQELQRTHAIVEIRVIDEHGEVRSTLQPTRVPLDRRHVFEMETKNLQPLVTSGTVKRVGLDHLWTRL